MAEEREQAIREASKLLVECLYDMQRTTMPDWQSLNISIAQVKVLMMLSFKGPMPISKLAEELGVSHPTISQLVDRLVQAGHVERVESATDRRITLARLTGDGELLAQRLWQGRMSRLRYCLSQLNEQEFTALQQGLRALNRISASLPVEQSAGEDLLEEDL